MSDPGVSTGMSGIVVRPVRFTDRVEEMASFLELIGLVRRVESTRGGWVELVGRAGMVALHDADSALFEHPVGQTYLAFEADDVEPLATSLRSAGFTDAAVHDEDYGRVLTVTDPLGQLLNVDEHSDDRYGYRVVEGGAPRGELRVVPVRFTDGYDEYAAFLRALGLTGETDPSFALFEAAGGEHGAVGVHHLAGDLPFQDGPGARVHLTFATREDLDDLAARLSGAGFASTRTDEDFGSFLDLTDPDGASVQVHGA